MLTVTKRAAARLKAAKAVQGAGPETGIRIRRVAAAKGAGESAQTVGFTVAEQPGPGDEESEQNGLRIFVDEQLVEILDGRTLDVWNESDEGQNWCFAKEQAFGTVPPRRADARELQPAPFIEARTLTWRPPCVRRGRSWREA
jgi:Fe-S cluster assembly iron-binding protein IscA